MKIVTFGTSLTAHGGWQNALETSLSACLQQKVSVEMVAKSGATSDWALREVGRVIAASPDIVLVELYANDAAFNRLMSVAASRENMDRLLTRLSAELPHARVIVMAMNPIVGLRGLIRPLIERYIDAHRLLAEEMGIEFIDHRPAWLSKTDMELRAAIPDGSHPLPDIAAAVMTPTLIEAISRKKCPTRQPRDT